MIKMAEMQKKVIKKEADGIEKMSDWKARVMGISKEMQFNGKNMYQNFPLR